MRLAIGRISDGKVEYAKRICAFVRGIYRELTLVVHLMDDNSEMKKKTYEFLVLDINLFFLGQHTRMII